LRYWHIHRCRRQPRLGLSLYCHKNWNRYRRLLHIVLAFQLLKRQYQCPQRLLDSLNYYLIPQSLRHRHHQKHTHHQYRQNFLALLLRNQC
jgi:hypothetical protein